MSKIVPFDFYGDALEVIPQGDKLWVAVKPICQGIGIDNATQQEKLKSKTWATTGLIPTVAQDGKIREVFAIDLESLPMWLANIDEGRVKEEIRPKLIRYQVECKKTLAEKFLGTKTATEDDDDDPLVRQAAMFMATAKRLAEHKKRIEAVEEQVLQIKTEQQQANDDLTTVERATEKPPEKTDRMRVVALHRAYCMATRADHRATWNFLYRELRDRHHFDAKVRAENGSKIGKKVSPLDVIEQAGLMGALFILASDLLRVQEDAA